MNGDAKFSDDELYRYWLKRSWGPNPKYVNFIMLNPSTADASINDPTITRCIGFAKDWHFHRLEVTNIFGLRSTEPKNLKVVDDPMGDDNDFYIVETALSADLIIAAWGTHGVLNDRGIKVLKILKNKGRVVHHLGLTKDGLPKHPLYLKKVTKPEEYDFNV